MAGSGKAHMRDPDDTLVRVEDLVVEYHTRRGVVHAVSGISFDVGRGETLGLVGESGCGKSTTGRAIVQLPSPTRGSVRFEGRELTELGHRQMRAVRPRLQMIYQDPISSLNPTMTVGEIITEPLAIWGIGTKESRQKVVSELLETVGMDPVGALNKNPRQFSGGQCQRICVARALVLEPEVLILDEPVSALDVSVQAQILNLLEDMKGRYGLTMVFIAHDLGVVRNVSDRVAVMYLGKMCEIGSSAELFAEPAHPYTDALISSIPRVDMADEGEAKTLPGEMPSPLNPPTGCRFRTRCPYAQERCAVDEPQLRRLVDDESRYVACHFPLRAAVDEVASHDTKVAI